MLTAGPGNGAFARMYCRDSSITAGLLDSTIEIGGMTKIYSSLSVAGAVTLASTLNVGGSLVVDGVGELAKDGTYDEYVTLRTNVGPLGANPAITGGGLGQIYLWQGVVIYILILNRTYI